jgi:hypothetical protein
MRGIIIMGLGLFIAFWVDRSYYGGMYSRETGDMVHHIASGFRH